MFTFSKIIGDTKNIEQRRRLINVEFIDGEIVFNKEFSFAIQTELEVIKKTIKNYLDNELNFVPPVVADITVTDAVEVPKTAAELTKEEWDKDRARLAVLMELVRDGVFTGTEKQITDLQAKVKAGFKATYLG